MDCTNEMCNNCCLGNHTHNVSNGVVHAVYMLSSYALDCLERQLWHSTILPPSHYYYINYQLMLTMGLCEKCATLYYVSQVFQKGTNQNLVDFSKDNDILLYVNYYSVFLTQVPQLHTFLLKLLENSTIQMLQSSSAWFHCLHITSSVSSRSMETSRHFF